MWGRSEHVYRIDNGPTGKWIPVLWKTLQCREEEKEIMGQKVLEKGGQDVKSALLNGIWEVYGGVYCVVEDSCDI